MLRKSKHKCYEIKMQGERLEGEMKKAKEWKEYTNGKIKERNIAERLEKKKERNICYLKYCAHSICYRLL